MENNLAYREQWREELIGGEWVAMAPATTNHNRVKGNIYAMFWNYLQGRECEVLPDGEGVFLSDTDEYIPDLMIICDPEKIRPDGVHGAPDLVVEVLSPGTAKYDRGKKKDTYEEAGVREYWIVNPEDQSIEQYFLKDGKYGLNNVYTVYPAWMLERMKPEERSAVATEFKCSLYDDLVIRLENVFSRVK